MTDICHKCTENGTFKFDQKQNCTPSKAQYGDPTDLLEVKKTPREWKHFSEGTADKAMHNQDVPIDALRQSDCVAVLD